MALFGGTGDERREPRSLVEFRAGKMSLSQGVVTADKRKGLVYMKTSSDSLLHFCWKDRQTGEVVDDLIIFPGEAEFVTVSQCTTGRVFLLKFKDHSSRKFFYWMQEPSTSKDKDLAKKVNDMLTHPPDPQAGGEGGMPDLPPGYMAIPSSQLQSMLRGGAVDQQQLMELLGGAGGIPHALAGGGLGRSGGMSAESVTRGSSQASHTPSSSALPTITPRAPARPTRSQQQQLDDLQSILSSLNVPGQTSAPQGQQSSPEDAVSLNEVLSSNVIRPLANDEEVVAELSPHLPPTGEGPESVLSSPQFQSALSTFHSGLESGQLGTLMSQFGLGDNVAQSAASGDLRAFAEALQGEMGGGVASGGGGEASGGGGVASDEGAVVSTGESTKEGGGGGEGEKGEEDKGEGKEGGGGGEGEKGEEDKGEGKEGGGGGEEGGGGGEEGGGGGGGEKGDEDKAEGKEGGGGGEEGEMKESEQK